MHDENSISSPIIETNSITIHCSSELLKLQQVWKEVSCYKYEGFFQVQHSRVISLHLDLFDLIEGMHGDIVQL